MGKKQLTTLFIILAVVVAAAFVIKGFRTSGLKAPSSAAGEKLLKDFPINSVAEISIKGAEEGVVLSRKEGEQWQVKERENYPADFEKIRTALRELWEVKIAQTVEAGPSQFGRLELLPPGGDEKEGAGTAVDFKNQDGEVLASLILGKQYLRQSDTPSPFGGAGGTPAGRYVKTPGEDQVLLISETLDNIPAVATDWLDKEFFNVSRVKSIEKISSDKDGDWKLERISEEVDEWRLLLLKPGEQLDSTKINSHKAAFSSPRFDDVVVGKKSLEDKATRFVVETFEGFKYDIAVSEELEDRKHHLTVSVDAKLPKEREKEEGESEEDAKKKDEEFEKEQEELRDKLEKEKALADRIYLVPNWTVSPLLVKRSEIIVAPAEDGAETTGEGGAPSPGAGGATPLMLQTPPQPAAAAPQKPRATAVTEPVGIDLTGDEPRIIRPEPKSQDKAKAKAAGAKPQENGKEAPAPKKKEGGKKAKAKPAETGAEKPAGAGE